MIYVGWMLYMVENVIANQIRSTIELNLQFREVYEAIHVERISNDTKYVSFVCLMNLKTLRCALLGLPMEDAESRTMVGTKKCIFLEAGV